jgi:hypothetical protein
VLTFKLTDIGKLSGTTCGGWSPNEADVTTVFDRIVAEWPSSSKGSRSRSRWSTAVRP